MTSKRGGTMPLSPSGSVFSHTGSNVSSPAPAAPSRSQQKQQREEEKQQARVLYSQHGVNGLLTAQPGKMTLKQLQAAVVAQQQMAAKQEAQVAEMTADVKADPTVRERKNKEQHDNDDAQGNGPNKSDTATSGVEDRRPGFTSHAFDYSVTPDTDDQYPGDALQMKEMIFLRSLALYQQHERSLQINPTKHRIGHVLMSEEQRDELEYQREQRRAEAKAAQRAADRAQAHNITSSARVISCVGETTARQPTFIVDASEAWPSRKRLLGKFLASVNKFVVRRRVDERLAAVYAHTQAQARQKQKQEKAALAAAHPLSLQSVHDEDAHLQRDFQLHTNNVQSVGHTRGHDSVTRTEVALEMLVPQREKVLFDEIIPFDTAVLAYPLVVAPPVPGYLRTDWRTHTRTGAWEESQLRGPTGEEEAPAATAAAGGKPGALVVHAVVPGKFDLHASPAHASPALLDSAAQLSGAHSSNTSKNATPLSIVTTPSATAAAASTTSSLSSTPGARSSAAASIAGLSFPSHLLAFHPIAQSHSIISSKNLSVPFPVPPSSTETSYTAAFRPSRPIVDVDTGYSYVSAPIQESSVRTLNGIDTLSALWRPRRDPPLSLGLLENLSLPVRQPRALRRQPKEDDLSDTDDDEYTPGLTFKAERPVREKARGLFANPQTSATMGLRTTSALSTTSNGGAAAASSSASAAAAASPALASPLDVGLGISLLSTVITYPSHLAPHVARAHAATIEAAAKVERLRKEKEERELAAEGQKSNRKAKKSLDPDASTAGEDGSSGGGTTDRSARPKAGKDPALTPVAPTLPRPRPAYSSANGLLTSETPVAGTGRAIHSEAFAAAAAASSSPAGGVSLPASVGWGAGGPAAAAALQQTLTWQQVQQSGALTRQMQAQHQLTAHGQLQLACVTQK